MPYKISENEIDIDDIEVLQDLEEEPLFLFSLMSGSRKFYYKKP